MNKHRRPLRIVLKRHTLHPLSPSDLRRVVAGDGPITESQRPPHMADEDCGGGNCTAGGGGH